MICFLLKYYIFRSLLFCTPINSLLAYLSYIRLLQHQSFFLYVLRLKLQSLTTTPLTNYQYVPIFGQHFSIISSTLLLPQLSIVHSTKSLRFTKQLNSTHIRGRQFFSFPALTSDLWLVRDWTLNTLRSSVELTARRTGMLNTAFNRRWICFASHVTPSDIISSVCQFARDKTTRFTVPPLIKPFPNRRCFVNCNTRRYFWFPWFDSHGNNDTCGCTVEVVLLSRR